MPLYSANSLGSLPNQDFPSPEEDAQRGSQLLGKRTNPNELREYHTLSHPWWGAGGVVEGVYQLYPLFAITNLLPCPFQVIKPFWFSPPVVIPDAERPVDI